MYFKNICICFSVIAETWEKYRKRYEHLGEKNPFSTDPPSPEYLISKYVIR